MRDIKLFIITFFLIFLPSVSLAQDEVWINYEQLPDTIKAQTDSTRFLRALILPDSCYEVDISINKRTFISTKYNTDGQIIYSCKLKSSASPIAWAIYYGMAIYFILMIFGNTINS